MSSDRNRKLKTIFFGTGKFAVPILESLITNGYWLIAVITAPDKPVGRKQILTPSPVKVVAQKHNIYIKQPKLIENLKLKIKNLQPDLIVVADYGQILPKEILDIPRYGCLNIHPSLLPKYRGPSPIQNTILNGDEKTGVTIILMDEKIDHGPILAQRELEFPIFSFQFSNLHDKLAELGAQLLIEIIPKWINGKIKPQPQDESKATYTKILKREDGKIDWRKSAEEIERQIRALNPEPGTYTYFKSQISKPKLLKILKAGILPIQEEKEPGEVFLTNNGKLAVACGQVRPIPGKGRKNALILEEVQPEGKRKMTAQEFLRGHPNFIGLILK